jgi:threonine dehydrogenase-like Zn-dependent dehydrogenase
MRATLYGGAGDISVGARPDPAVESPTDAVVRVALDRVCGSDLGYFLGQSTDERRAVKSLLRIGPA